MARPQGVRNRDFDEKRAKLLATLTDYALNSDLKRPSLRQFALAAGASEPTLRHYFVDRAGLVEAILQEIGVRGERIWALARTPSASIEDAVSEYLTLSEGGARHRGFVRAHAFGLIEGLADAEAGRAYAIHVLDPALDAVAEKFRATPEGPQSAAELRTLGLMLLAPLLLAVMRDEFLKSEIDPDLDLTSCVKILGDWTIASLSAGAASSDN
ncbi:MAG: hypothetical protein AAGB25_06225 [Pseudomonadota bacterium]